jgi:uncharacterized protein (TIGR03663 family)
LTRKERLAWILLIAGALLLRVAALGSRPPHHDEAVHCDFAYNLLHGAGYRYDPTYHGPLLFYVIAPLFAVLGESTVVARLYPALAGTALVVLPLLLRRRLGAAAAWWTALLLAISPNLLYYSRFVRSDVPVELFTAAALVLLLRVRDKGWRVIPWIGVLAAAHATSIETFYVTLPLLGLATCAVALRQGLWRSVRRAWAWLKRYRLAVASAGAWFVVITIVAYTVFFVHLEDWLFPLKAITYWYHQHEIRRVGGPWNFYLVRLAAYEFLPLAAAIAWSLRRFRHLKPLEVFCLVWGVSAIALYAYLGEKTPWLIVHQIVPFFPLAGCQVARSFSFRGRWWSRGLVAAGLAATAWSAVAASFLYPTISPNDPHAELLVFVQTTPEEEAIAERGLELARTAGEGPVAAVSGEGTWPLSWQWKKLNVWWAQPEAGMRPPLVVCDPGDETVISDRLGARYRERRIPLRAWWVEDLSRATPGRVARWFFTRRPWSPVGATDIVVFERTHG